MGFSVLRFWVFSCDLGKAALSRAGDPSAAVLQQQTQVGGWVFAQGWAMQLARRLARAKPS